jgi:hypothetical protein
MKSALARKVTNPKYSLCVSNVAVTRSERRAETLARLERDAMLSQ